jgi:methylphosphotriester-DNA--protein-cysteine methyltransferase
MEIEDTIKVVKDATHALRRVKRERDEINETAKKQRVEIRRLKRLLKATLDLVPQTVRADKLFVEIDEALHKEER